jgi:transaldolase
MTLDATSEPKHNLKVAIYADGANKDQMLELYRSGKVSGFTTNPTLMAKAGIRDYERFAREIVEQIHDMPISFEVFSDDFEDMERQARIIATWGPNVNIKVPITNTKGESTIPLVRNLLDSGAKLNVTAILTRTQLMKLREVVRPNDDVIVSIFAGRIADTGIDPEPIMKEAVEAFSPFKKCKILWASPREVLNAYQAERCGCHIITATADLISKLSLYGKSLDEFSLETVKMFYVDAQKAGFVL